MDGEPSDAAPLAEWRFVESTAPVPAEIKKRKRTSTAPLACEPCSQKHLKCDGVQPCCSRCSRAGDQCVYVAKRRKQRPLAQSAGKRNKTSPTQQIKTKNSDVLLMENHLSNSFNYSSYVQMYETYIDAVCLYGSAGEPDRHYNSFQDTTDPQRLLFMNAILSTGALMTGNKVASEAYYMATYNLMKDLYDEPTLLVAATHTLISYRHSMMGDMDKAVCSNAFAITALKQLLRQSNTTDPNDQSISHGTHYLRCLTNEVDLVPADGIGRGSVKQCITKILSLNEQMFLPQETKEAVKKVCQFLVLREDAIKAPQQYLGQYLPLFGGTLTKFDLKTNVHRAILLALRAISCLQLYAGNTIAAIDAADKLMDFAQQSGVAFCDLNMIKGLFCAGQVYVRLGLPTKYTPVINFLWSVGESAPLALRTIARLEQMKELVELHLRNHEALSYIPIQLGWAHELVELPMMSSASFEEESSGSTQGVLDLSPVEEMPPHFQPQDPIRSSVLQQPQYDSIVNMHHVEGVPPTVALAPDNRPQFVQHASFAYY